MEHAGVLLFLLRHENIKSNLNILQRNIILLNTNRDAMMLQLTSLRISC